MPNVKDFQSSYPSGAYTDANKTVNMSELDFVIALASDGDQIDKTQSIAKLSSYVDPKFSDRVQEAYDAGIYLGALIRLHFGAGYEYDINNPAENPQLERVCYALKNRTPGRVFHFIVIEWETTDTPGNTAKALAHHVQQIRDEYGVKTFLQIKKEEWENYPDYDNLVSPVDAPYPLCIPDQAGDGIIETPGQFTISKGLIWTRNGLYAFWGNNFADFLGSVPVNAGTQPPAEEEIPPEGGDDGTGDDQTPTGEGYAALVAELKILNAHLAGPKGEAIITIAGAMRKLSE